MRYFSFLLLVSISYIQCSDDIYSTIDREIFNESAQMSLLLHEVGVQKNKLEDLKYENSLIVQNDIDITLATITKLKKDISLHGTNLRNLWFQKSLAHITLYNC